MLVEQLRCPTQFPVWVLPYICIRIEESGVVATLMFTDPHLFR